MKMLKSWVPGMAAVACVAVLLSILAGPAMAGKRPPQYLLWPDGATLDVVEELHFFDRSRILQVSVGWPVASDADHYRVTVVAKGTVSAIGKRMSRVVTDSSPVYLTSYNFTDWTGANTVVTYTITITAYSDPDETVAYSESLQYQLTFR